ncbi:MAG: hypothetical protein GX596_05965 [Propionibacterium sp.]|nr:hypothetical protein [Propionibacterium sp.]
MSLVESVTQINYASIASAGSGLRDLHLETTQLGPAVGAALTISRTRALRMTRGLVESAETADQAADEVGALVEWAAREGADARGVVADAMRISGGELLLVDRMARLPRTEARAFVGDWLGAGGDRRAVAHWLATVGAVLREHHGARPTDGDSGGVIDWIKEAAQDAVDFITEAVETIVDAIVDAGEALVDLLGEVVQWTIDQVGDLVEALLEAGMTIGQLLVDAVEAGVTVFKKFVKALIEVGKTVLDVLKVVVEEAIGVVADTLRALMEIGRTLGQLLVDAARLAVAAMGRVLEALRSIGQSVLQILRAAAQAVASVMRATIEAFLNLGRTLTSLIRDVITGELSITEAFVRALRAMGRSVRDVLDAARDAATKAVRDITRALSRIGAELRDLVDWAADAAANFARQVIQALVSIGTTVVNLVTTAAARALKVMRTVIDGLYAAGRTFVQLLRELADIAGDLLEKFLEAAFALGATIIEFVGETFRNTYAAARRMVEAALRAGAALADLLTEAAKHTYFTLRKMVFAVADAVGLGEVMRWAADRLEHMAENLFHDVLSALRYVGARLKDVLDWAVEASQEVFDAVVDAWESIRENLLTLYRWASGLASDLAAGAWEQIGRATSRFRNSVRYVLTFLEKDFLPGVAMFVRGLLQAGYELAWLVARVVRRGVALIGEVLRELARMGVALADILLATLRSPSDAWDNLLAALDEVGSTWKDILAAVEAAGEDVLDEIIDAARRSEGLRAMLDGAVEVAGGFIGMVVSQLFNLLATYRPLTVDEKRAAEPVFAGSIDLDLVSISHESCDNDIIFAIQDFFSSSDNPRAFVTGTLINMDVNNPIDTPTLIHELTHVWQHEVAGPLYLAEAVHAQVTDPNAYDYGGVAGLVSAGGDFDEFNPEQQGDIVRDYYVRRYVDGRPEPDWAAFTPYIDVVQAA